MSSGEAVSPILRQNLAMIINLLRKWLQKYGYTLVGKDNIPADILQDEQFLKYYKAVRPCTMTSVERLYSLLLALRYISANNISGDFVECGVWKGGSSMLMALHLREITNQDTKIFMYDTFAGMPPPGKFDTDASGKQASDLLETAEKTQDIWAISTLDEVEQNLRSTGLPASQIKYVVGKVEDTIPQTMPEKISLLRLDTDWYESTQHELQHLYPRLVNGGVLIIDDYGFWKGSRKAVDEYFASLGILPLLQRIDDTGRMFVKA